MIKRKHLGALLFVLASGLSSKAQELSAEDLISLARSEDFSGAIKKKGFKYKGTAYEQYHESMVYGSLQVYKKGGCSSTNNASLTQVGLYEVLKLETVNDDYKSSLMKAFEKLGFGMYKIVESDDETKATDEALYRSESYQGLELRLRIDFEGSCQKFVLRLVEPKK